MPTFDGLSPQSSGDDVPYNHIFRIPIRTKQAPKLHTVQLLVYPDWTPSGDTTTIHMLFATSVSASSFCDPVPWRSERALGHSVTPSTKG